MKKPSNFAKIIIRAIVGFVVLLWNLFSVFVNMYPERVREFIGDKLIDFYEKVPLAVWGVVAGIVFIGFVIREMWLARKVSTGKLLSESNHTETNTQMLQHNKSGFNIGKQSAETINNYFGDSDYTKEGKTPSIENGMAIENSHQNRNYQKIEWACVIEGDTGSRPNQYASIRVKNVDNGEFQCFAKLTKLSKVLATQNGENQSIIELDKMNPKDCFLQWDNQQESTVLQIDKPRVIRLVSKMGAFLFFEWQSNIPFHGYDLSKKFLIEVELFRKSGSKLIKIKTIKRSLRAEPIVYRGGFRGYTLDWEKVES